MNLEKLLNRRGRGGRRGIQMLRKSTLTQQVAQFNSPSSCFFLRAFCVLCGKTPFLA